MTSSSGTKRAVGVARARCRRASRASLGVGSTATNRGSSGGTLTRAKCSLSVTGLRSDHRQVERQAGDVGERVGRVHRERGEHREHLLAEEPVQALLLARSESWSQCTSTMPCSASAGRDLVARTPRRAGPAARGRGR